MNTDSLSTPVYLKTDKFEWPEDKLFYLMTSDGLMLCRNHPWFTSCAPAKKGPSELLDQKPFIKLGYPLIPRALLERALGFFHKVFKAENSESALIVAWNRQTEEMELVCPEQEVSHGSVHYTIPALPPHLALIGDIHSHCNFSPNASFTDENDETNRPGLHVVAGYIDKEPPQFFCVAVVDGQRFEVKDHSLIIEDYIQRDTKSVPEEWMGKVKKKVWSPNYSSGGGNWMYLATSAEKAAEMEIIRHILASHVKSGKMPSKFDLTSELFRSTKFALHGLCEKKAEKFLKHWPELPKETHEELVGKE